MSTLVSLVLHSESCAATVEKMLHVVVLDMRNKVDRIVSTGYVDMPSAFPANATPLNMDDPRMRDIVTIGLTQQGVDPGDDATLVGRVYQDGGYLHVAAWVDTTPDD
ncbi:hypothetical protein [Burkholderia mayonis]|uniref:Uncharacterized protein n=1 Tax=Burkholderia mayonis TaxID=1385591 RepID=A0A1B4G146_9BURK|nr:hypothetical protein [Burkholderia mayonis]AOJ09636.1 hypothetical protein WS71_20190 [Burkholderia mayonis]KVE52257.1 hypothetical protein WS71_10015 [Burkholderia mayonis]